MNKLKRFGTLGFVLILTAASTQPQSGRFSRQEEYRGLPKRIVVSADSGWVDTSLEAEQGDRFFFQASGEISLQKGNPAAHCGPDGLDLRTVQQPIPDQNLGALVGKVSQLISVKIDEDTGEEIRDEIFSLFFIGSGGQVTMPIRGRIHLGINENVVKDNSGGFTVVVFQISD